MQLDRLLTHLTYERVQGSQNREITDICYHSGKVKKGSLFVCLKGMHADGHDYLMDALETGATAVVIARENTVAVEGDILLYMERFGIRVSEILRDWDAAVVAMLCSALWYLPAPLPWLWLSRATTW